MPIRLSQRPIGRRCAATRVSREPLTDSPLPSLDGFPARLIDIADDAPKAGGEKQTAKRAVQVLLDQQAGFHLPTARERDALLVAFAMRRQVLYGAAFDIVKLHKPVELIDPAAIAADLDALTIYEIKSTNKNRTREDFGGYFFDLTTAELLVAQSLGARYKFAFVNIITNTWIEMSLQEVFAKARKVYPKWAISF
jgi:hypothetical protein